MVLKSKESFEKQDKSKTYSLRGQRKARYPEKTLSNKKKSNNFNFISNSR